MNHLPPTSAVQEKRRSTVLDRSHEARTVIYIYLGLFVAIVCTYAGVAHCGFVNLDDFGYIHQNPFVRSGFSWENAHAAFTSFRGSLWIPLTWISFMVDVSLFGLNPAYFHIENVLIHAAAALLLFQGLHRATGRLWTSAIVAALFGLHPINVESVAWVTERKNVLCTLFWILAMNAYLRYGAGERRRDYWWALTWFILALMSKPMAVTLPGTLLLLDLWPLRRDLAKWPRLILEKAPFFVLTGATCLVALAASHSRGTIQEPELLSFGARASNALISYGWYLRDFAWPVHLAVFYPHPYYAQPVLAGIALVILLGITGGAIWHFRTRPYLLVGWLWFLGVMVPMLGLVQVGSQGRADRFTYVAQIGIFIAIVWLIADLCSENRRRLMSAVTAIVLSALALQTAAEIPNWTNTVTLYERAIEQTEPNVYVRVGAARARMAHGDANRAVEHFEAALRIAENYDDIWRDYGRALTILERKSDAVRAFGVALGLDPEDAETRYYLATTLEEIGGDDAAIAQFKEVIRRKPHAIEVYEALARLLNKKGRNEEALGYQEASARLRAQPK